MGKWDIPRCLVLTCLPNYNQGGAIPMHAYEPHPRKVRSRRAHGANCAKWNNVLPANPSILLCLSPHNNPMGPGFRTVYLSTIVCIHMHSQRCWIPHMLMEHQM